MSSIVFKNVSKQFDETFALEDISFSISPGELVMVTGPSGSGKTTLMRLLMREYTPNSGEIMFDEAPLSRISPRNLHHHRRKIGVVFQDYKLLPELTVWENIALALSIIGATNSDIERRVTDLLDLVSLTDKAFLFPAQLSGGEAQRVSIARALSTAPKVIFADEPTGNLDAEVSENIIKLLKKINDLGTTVLVTTHNHDVKSWLGQIRHLQIEKGKVVSDSHAQKAKQDSKKEKESKKDTSPDLNDEDNNDNDNPDNSSNNNANKQSKENKKQKKSRFSSWFSFLSKNSDTSNKTDTTQTNEDNQKEQDKKANSKKNQKSQNNSSKNKDENKEAEFAVEIENL